MSAALLLLTTQASGLVIPPPVQVQVQHAQPTLRVEALSSVFPSSGLLLAENARIEAAKAATAAKRAKFEADAPPAAEASAPQGQVVSRPCPDLDDPIWDAGSSQSGKMVSRSCSAQRNQQKAMAAQARAKQLAAERAAAEAAADPGFQLPQIKLPF